MLLTNRSGLAAAAPEIHVFIIMPCASCKAVASPGQLWCCTQRSCSWEPLCWVKSFSISPAGDDDGAIKLWDTRQGGTVGGFSAHTDYITDFAVHDAERSLLAVSGDGTLSVNDLRKLKVNQSRGGVPADESVSNGALEYSMGMPAAAHSTMTKLAH